MIPNTEANEHKPRTMPGHVLLGIIRKQVGSLRLMAEQIGCSPSSLHGVVHGRVVGSRIASEIAKVVSAARGAETRPCDIWPKLYAEDGGPKSTAYRRLPKAS